VPSCHGCNSRRARHSCLDGCTCGRHDVLSWRRKTAGQRA
jgi:hypothetical protein